LLAAQADAERIPFIDESFDAVLCGEVLEHLADDAAAVAGFRRVLKPGGLCIVTVPAWPRLWTFCDDYAGHHRRYGRDALVTLFESSGLRVLYVGNWGFPLIRLYQRFVFRPYVRRQETAGATSIVAPRRVPSSLAHMAMSITSYLFALDNLFLWTRWGVGLVLIAEKAES
jgi:SAM-dependent methyltransferase